MSTSLATKKTATRRDLAALEARRLAAADLFDQGATQAQVVRELGVSAQSASRWHVAWRTGGPDALRSVGTPGRAARLTPGQWTAVEAALDAGAEAAGFDGQRWTLARVTTLIAQLTGVVYHPSSTSRLLRQAGWRPQVPARRARERDQAAVETWKKEAWPAVMGGGQANQVDCVLRRGILAGQSAHPVQLGASWADPGRGRTPP